MKNLIQKLAPIALCLIALSSCGKDKNNNNTAVAQQCQAGMIWNGTQCVFNNNTSWNNMTASQCPVGQVHTQQFGCITPTPGVSCPAGQVSYNNQCIAVTTTMTNPMVGPMTNPMAPNTMNPMVNPMMGPMMPQPMMNTGFGIQFGMNTGMNTGMGPNFNMGSEMGSYSDCPATSEDDMIYYSCEHTNHVSTAGMSVRQRRKACARGLILTSYGCLPKKGCRRGYGNLDGYCVR